MKTETPSLKQSERPSQELASIETILEKAYRIHRWDRLSREAVNSALSKKVGRSRTKSARK